MPSITKFCWGWGPKFDQASEPTCQLAGNRGPEGHELKGYKCQLWEAGKEKNLISPSSATTKKRKGEDKKKSYLCIHVPQY